MKNGLISKADELIAEAEALRGKPIEERKAHNPDMWKHIGKFTEAESTPEVKQRLAGLEYCIAEVHRRAGEYDLAISLLSEAIHAYGLPQDFASKTGMIHRITDADFNNLCLESGMNTHILGQTLWEYTQIHRANKDLDDALKTAHFCIKAFSNAFDDRTRQMCGAYGVDAQIRLEKYYLTGEEDFLRTAMANSASEFRYFSKLEVPENIEEVVDRNIFGGIANAYLNRGGILTGFANINPEMAEEAILVLRKAVELYNKMGHKGAELIANLDLCHALTKASKDDIEKQLEYPMRANIKFRTEVIQNKELLTGHIKNVTRTTVALVGYLKYNSPPTDFQQIKEYLKEEFDIEDIPRLVYELA